MKISFDNAIMLILIPIAIFIIIFFGRNIKSYSKIRRNIFITIRSIICIIMILALSGVRVSKVTDSITTVFCADVSASSRESIKNTNSFFEESKKYATENMLDGTVIFGGNAVVEKKPDENRFDLNFKGYVSDDLTNIQEALKMASNIFEEDTAKRIVLISDGSENIGDAIKEAMVLKSKNIVVDSYIPEKSIDDEVQITALNIDKYINKNVSYKVGVEIDSTVDTTAVLRLYKDNILIYNENINISNGNNKIVVNDISEKGGSVIYRAVIEPVIDTYSENNQIYENCYIEDVPSVLVIDSDNSSREIKKILEASKLNIVETEAEAAPSTIEQLEKYDAVVISDVNIDKLSDEFLQSLDTYVKNIGGGLLVTSGENSLALGGYFGSTLENMLPVNMQLKTEGQNPDLGMVFVIDHSGSMSDSNYGISRLEMAKEAVIRSIDTLRPEDTLGVLSFDDTTSWVWEPSVIGENSISIKNEVSKMQPAGGTSILPALDEAYNKLKDTNAKIKHIVLLTDGQAEKEGYDYLVNSMKAEGITLSTVAVGSGADTTLLKNLAEKSDGRYYFTNEFTDLPKIFANETFLAGKDYINNRSFYPSAGSYSEIIENISEVPQIDGYISSTIKQGADMVLSTDKEEPLLATWQYGIGRTAVWTSDVNGKWTSNWLADENGNDIFRNTISWIMKKQISDEFIATAEIKDNKSIVTVKSSSNKTIENISGKIISFDNNEYDINLGAVSAGVFEGEFEETKEGSYIMNLTIKYKDGSEENINTAFNIHYPVEYDMTRNRNGEDLIKKITEITGGKIITSSSEVYSDNINQVYSSVRIDNILIIIGLILFIFDIFIRRFNFISDKIEKALCSVINIKNNKSIKKEFKPVENMKKEKSIKKDEPIELENKNETSSKLLKVKKNRKK